MTGPAVIRVHLQLQITRLRLNKHTAAMHTAFQETTAFSFLYFTTQFIVVEVHLVHCTLILPNK